MELIKSQVPNLNIQIPNTAKTWGVWNLFFGACNLINSSDTGQF
jgi:hypothetical protein